MKKYSELLTIPVGLLLLWLFMSIGEQQQWHLYGLGIFQKLFLGFVIFLVVIGVCRLIFRLTFPTLYRYIDNDFNENKEWTVFTPRERAWAGLLLLVSYFVLFGLIVANL